MKRSALTILLLIPLTLLTPAIGFGGEPPPMGSSPVLPAYMGNLTVEWQSTNNQCTSVFWNVTAPCGNLIIYGRLNCAEKKCKDIIITKRNPITLCNNGIPVPIAQMDFLSLEPAYLTLFGGYNAYTLPLAGPGTYFVVTSANDLSYQSDTLFTVDVVVMQFE